MRARLSIRGLYETDTNVFENFYMLSELDREVIINQILLECGDFSVIYPSLEGMKFAIGTWSRSHLHIWKHMYETTQYEYNPIQNYDRHEEIFDSRKETTDSTVRQGEEEQINRDESRHTEGNRDDSDSSVVNSTIDNSETRDLTNTSNASGTNDTTTNIEGDSSSNVSRETRAFNTSGLQKTSADDTTNSNHELSDTHAATSSLTTDKETGSVTSEGNSHSDSKNTLNSTSTDNTSINAVNSLLNNKLSTSTNANNEENTHEAYIYGNIGVTTTQQMIEEERRIAEFNIYNYIVDDFKRTFCVMVY